MNNVLVVSGSEKSLGMLVQLIKDSGPAEISTVANGGEVRRAIVNTEYDLVVINTPLSDEFGHELAISVTEASMSGCIMLVKSELSDNVASKVEPFGIIVVTKPISKVMFYQAVRLTYATKQRFIGLQSENQRLQKKIEEIKLVDRAKCALIEHLNYTEQEAHKQIEKDAMDSRRTKREVALEVLKKYDT